MITQDQVKDLFDYRDGELYWKVNLARKGNIGDKAGCLASTGYLQSEINKKLYYNHRIIFLMFYGHLPKFIDHIDGNRSNNQIENLREATKSENGYNSKKSKANTSGVKNVCWAKKQKKWQVQLQVKGKKKCFGQYHDIKIAKFIAETMRYKYYGNFAHHGEVT